MRDSLLLLMTPGMSLEKWDSVGQLSREINYYEELSKRSGLRLIIFSYGRNDDKYNLSDGIVLTMPEWIPKRIPYRVQNLIYNVCSIFIYRTFFRQVLICKTNQFSAASFGLVLKFIFKVPLIIRMGFYYSHFKSISKRRVYQEQFSFRNADLILTTSPEASEAIIKKYNIPVDKIVTIFNSINTERFKPVNVKKEWDLLFVGRLEEQKNIHLILKVMNSIPGKSLIIGEGSLDILVKEAIKGNDKITWMNRVDNVNLPTFYNQAKCFLLLSNHEGNPKVLLEAMACGLLCVGTNVNGIRECVVHNVNGIIVPKDADQAVSTICSLLADEEAMSRIGNNAVDWVRNNCEYSKNIDKEVLLYNKISKVSYQSKRHVTSD